MSTAKGSVMHTKKFNATGVHRQDYRMESKDFPYIDGTAEIYVDGKKCATNLEFGIEGDNGVTKQEGYKVMVIEFGAPGFFFTFLHDKETDTPKLGTEIVVKYKVEVNEKV